MSSPTDPRPSSRPRPLVTECPWTPLDTLVGRVGRVGPFLTRLNLLYVVTEPEPESGLPDRYRYHHRHSTPDVVP